MIAHIDADLIVYAVASACEGKYWEYKGEQWTSKALLNKQLKLDGLDESSVTLGRSPESWEDCRNSVISYVDNIVSHIDTDHKLYISGKGNFRFGIATILPYKGNRASFEKPFHYDNVRQLLVDGFDAEVSEDMEADDLIGISHDPNEDIIVTRDKDLNCIEGLHYNWVTGECSWINELDSYKHFYQQVLTGDDTDNILGLYGVGKSSQHVKNILTMSNEKEIFDYVAHQYQLRFGSYWKQFMLEHCRLLWILQRRVPAWEERLI